MTSISVSNKEPEQTRVVGLLEASHAGGVDLPVEYEPFLERITRAWEYFSKTKKISESRLRSFAWGLIRCQGVLKDFSFAAFKTALVTYINETRKYCDSGTVIESLEDIRKRFERGVPNLQHVTETDFSHLAQIIQEYAGGAEDIHRLVATSFTDHEQEVWAREDISKMQGIIEKEWNDLTAEERSRITNFAWQVAGRPGPLKDFSPQTYVATLNPAQAVQFYRGCSMRNDVLFWLEARRPSQTLGILKSHASKHLDPFSSVAERVERHRSRIILEFLGDIAFVLCGGRERDAIEGLNFLSDDDIRLVVKNRGCLLPSDGDRKAIGEFLVKVATRDDKGRVVPGNIPAAYEWLQNTSPDAAELLVEVLDRYLGNTLFQDGQISLTKIEALDGLDIVHCANVIDQYENRGILVSPSKTRETFILDTMDILHRRYKENVQHELHALSQFVESYKKAIADNYNYTSIKQCFAAFMKRSPALAEDLATFIGKKYEDLAGKNVVAGGRMIIEITNKDTIIADIFSFLMPMIRERESILKSLDSAPQEKADCKSNLDR